MPRDGLVFVQIVEKVIEKCNLEEFQQFVAIARRIWLRRNDVIYGGACIHPSAVIKGALQALVDFASANNLEEDHQPHVNGFNVVR
jgi:ribonuclease HI